jgi:hypothetical protein
VVGLLMLGAVSLQVERGGRDGCNWSRADNVGFRSPDSWSRLDVEEALSGGTQGGEDDEASLAAIGTVEEEGGHGADLGGAASLFLPRVLQQESNGTDVLLLLRQKAEAILDASWLCCRSLDVGVHPCPCRWSPRLDVGRTIDPALAAAVALRQDAEPVEAAGEETVDGTDAETHNVGGTEGGSLWLISHYFCEGDSTGAYCPWGRATASGLPVSPGLAACDASLLGVSVEVSGIGFLCADTGGAIGPAIIDIWCYSAFCWDEACTEACPAPCEQVINGRCYAAVTVLGCFYP